NVTTERIEAREHELLQKVFTRWLANPAIEILGNLDPSKRVGIISFNIKANDKHYLHPKFVTTLLNDLFCIQSRAGCSCAGPYGHRLLDIDEETSEQYRRTVTDGYSGIKPGWCRVSMHYVMDDLEVNYLLDAVDFVAEHGELFLRLYDFDIYDGSWNKKDDPTSLQRFSLESALAASMAEEKPMSFNERQQRYSDYLNEAFGVAEDLQKQAPTIEYMFEGSLKELQFFALPECCMIPETKKGSQGFIGKLKSVFSLN
ncbi:MAG: aminotransferase class V-fold PLP-dependent enzyme, partial [Xanthomonadales bacterium]|nr:aminotransferase class V-fold PLP-dependent enzyme [Xanthomonadales bacterium]